MKVEKRFPMIHQTIVQLKEKDQLSLEQRYFLFNMVRKMKNTENDWKAVTESYNIPEVELGDIIQFNLNKEKGQAIYRNILGIIKNQWIERDRQPNKLLADATLALGSNIDPRLIRELSQFEEERKQLQTVKQKLVAHDAQEWLNIDELEQALNIEIEKQYNNENQKNSGQNVTMAYKKLSFRIKHITDEALPTTTKVYIWKEYFEECAKELSSVDPEKSAKMTQNAKTLEDMALQANKCESYDSIVGACPTLNSLKLLGMPKTFYIPAEIESLTVTEQNWLGLEYIKDEIWKRNLWLKREECAIKEHFAEGIESKYDVFSDSAMTASDIKDLIIMEASASLEEIGMTERVDLEKKEFLEKIKELKGVALFREGARQDLLTYYRAGLLKYGKLTEENHYYPAKVLATLDTRHQLQDNLENLRVQLEAFNKDLPSFSTDRLLRKCCGGREKLIEIMNIVDQVVGGKEKTDDMATFLSVVKKLVQTTEADWRATLQETCDYLDKMEERRIGKRVRVKEQLPSGEREKIMELRGEAECLSPLSKLLKNLNEADVTGKGLFGNYDYGNQTKKLFLNFVKLTKLYVQQMIVDTAAVQKRHTQLEDEAQAGATPGRGRR